MSGPLPWAASQTSAKTRSLVVSMTGKPPASQKFSIPITQAGTLLANGGAAEYYLPTDPSSGTVDIVVNTIHSGSVTQRGTIAITTGGSVTLPTFSPVALAAGDTFQLVAPGTQDGSFADFAIAMQMVVT
jgi:hypothetical protein